MFHRFLQLHDHKQSMSFFGHIRLIAGLKEHLKASQPLLAQFGNYV
jgi:hypothetical protein